MRQIEQRLKVAVIQSGRKVVTHNFKSDLPLKSRFQMKIFADLFFTIFIHRLLHTYNSPEDVDMYIAQVMERIVPGTHLGPTGHCLIKQQFENSKRGDRFFYTNPKQFTVAQLEEIKKQSLASILCIHADEPSQMRFEV